MFFNKPKSPTKLEQLPDELIILILDRLPLKDAFVMLRVSSQMNALIKDNSIWKSYGAKNFEEFANQYKKLRPQARLAIKKYGCTLKCANKYCSLKTEERTNLLVKEILQLPDVQNAEYVRNALSHFHSNAALISWDEKLITWNQINSLVKLEQELGSVMAVLFSNEFRKDSPVVNTVRILRENKSFLDELIRTEIRPEILIHLLQDDGVKAIQYGLTIEDASKAKTEDEIKKMIETKISKSEPTDTLSSDNPLKKEL